MLVQEIHCLLAKIILDTVTYIEETSHLKQMQYLFASKVPTINRIINKNS